MDAWLFRREHGVVSLLALLGNFATGQKSDQYLVSITWEGPSRLLLVM